MEEHDTSMDTDTTNSEQLLQDPALEEACQIQADPDGEQYSSHIAPDGGDFL